MNLIQPSRYPQPAVVSATDWSSPFVEDPTPGFSKESMVIGEFLNILSQSSATTPITNFGLGTQAPGVLRVMPTQEPSRIFHVPQKKDTLEHKLYETLAAFKIHTAQIAMHISSRLRSKLFQQLDSLLGLEDWLHEDEPPSLASFSTFLRMMLSLKPLHQPGLGATDDGHLVAMWTTGADRLTIECLANDRIRWVLSRRREGETESAAGSTDLSRLAEVLAPYNPTGWFGNGYEIHSG